MQAEIVQGRCVRAARVMERDVFESQFAVNPFGQRGRLRGCCDAGLFGEQLYGHAPKWDHKTVFSVLAWATIAVLLIGRSRFGWRGRKAVHVLYVGAALLLLAYVGSRFVLEIILGRAT